MLKYLPAEQVKRIHRRLERLYGDRADRLMERLSLCLDGARSQVKRDEAKRAAWDESDCVLITYADSIAGEREAPLRTLDRFARERLDGAVRTIHLLPFFPWSSDDGFSVIDYRKVNEEVGTWSDVERLGEAFDLMFDLVLNHVSSRSSWFRDYRRGIAPGRNYFVEVESGTELSEVVRPRSLPLLTSVNTPQGERWVWTTFSEDQVDLDFGNPDVLFEFVDILLLYLSKGARILRLDAIAYLWKEIGTSCIHLPETHEVVRLLRDILELAGTDALILTETNVPHEENVSYFGKGYEAHMVYQFSLPPLLLHALHTGNAAYLTDWAARLREPPPGCTFLNFTASHDGIGVRPLHGLVPDEDLNALTTAVRERGGHVSTRDVGGGKELPYELNITYFDALGDGADDVSPMQIARFLCSQIIAMSLKGMPAVYIHSLTATRNDYAGVEVTQRARSINRKQWKESELLYRLDDPDATEHTVFEEYTRLLRVRRECSAFHPDAAQRVLNLGDRVFAVIRKNEDSGDIVVCAANLSPDTVEVSVKSRLPKGKGWLDRIGGEDANPRAFSLAPYQVVWLTPKR